MPAFHPTIHRLLRGCRLLLATGALLTGANAQIVNGGFESPTPFAGWTLEYSTYNDFGSGPVFGPWVTAPPVGHPAPAIWSGGQPFNTTFLAVQPYEGNQMARLNDPTGLHHATRLRQSFHPSGSDIASGFLAVQWGAMLQYAHVEGQPGFRVEVFKNGISVQTHQADTNDALSEGWQATGPVGPTLPPGTMGPSFYYKHGQMEAALPNLVTTDTIEVQLTVWDCDAGGHGGFAFFDDVRFPTCTAVPTLASMCGWWHDSTGVNLASIGWYSGTGTWVGTPPVTSGRVGGDGLNHSGVAHVRVPDSSPLNFYAHSNLSLDLWVKPASVFNGLQPLVCKVYSGPGWHQLGYAFYLDHGHPAVMLGDYSGGTTGLQAYVASSVVVPADEWTFLAFTLRRTPVGPVGTFYVNGEPLTQTFVPMNGTSIANGLGSGVPAPPDLLIGKFPSGFNTWSGGTLVAAGPNVFDGETDEVELFRSELKPELVAAIFASGAKGKCRPTPPDQVDHPLLAIGNQVANGSGILSSGIGLPFALSVLGNSYSFVHVSTSGFLYLSNGSAAPGSATGFGSPGTMVANLRNGPARIAPYWCNLDLQPANGGGVYYAELANPDRIVVTWKNAVEVGYSTQKTIQCQIFASGEILFDYVGSIAAEGGNVLCGISAGGGIADPGASDLSASALGTTAILYENFGPAQPFDLSNRAVLWAPNSGGYEALPDPIPQSLHVAYGSGCLPGMSLSAAPDPLPGAVVTYTTSNLPEVFPGSGAYVNVLMISFGQIPSPGIDLGFLGAPGCSVLVASLDILLSSAGATSNQGVPITIPSVGASGLSFYVQSLALDAIANPAGFVTSNGIASTIP